jgi:hypothetical protein
MNSTIMTAERNGKINQSGAKLPREVEVANLCEAVTRNIHSQFEVTNLCEAGTGNIHQEPSLPREIEVANLCEAVTGIILSYLCWTMLNKH